MCETCKRIDCSSLLFNCVRQCQETQKAYDDGADGAISRLDDTFTAKHHDDIFEVEKLLRGCDLCRVIFQAFERRKVANAKDVTGLPIVFRSYENKIEVCYCSAEEGLIKLCGLDVYMNEVDSE